MSARPLQATTIKDWGILLFLGLIWGCSFLFANIAVREIPPVTLVFLRVGFASLALCIVMVIQGLSFRPFIENWRGFTVLGLLSCALPFFLIASSQRFIGPGLGGILNATVPIFMVPLAHFLTKDERLTLRKALGVILGFSGVVVLLGPAAISHFSSSTMAALAALTASLSYAFGGLEARKFKKYPALVISTGGLLISSIFMLPISLLYDRSLSLPMPSLHALSAILALALLSTTFAFVIFYWLIGRIGATNTSLVTFLIPISAVIVGTMFSNETFGWNDFAGMLIIGVSLLIIDGRLFSRRITPIGENIHEGTVAK
jgi:drug/metabolite transporter (DMT)-like permease